MYIENRVATEREAIPMTTAKSDWPMISGEIKENYKAAPIVPNRNGVKIVQKWVINFSVV